MIDWRDFAAESNRIEGIHSDKAHFVHAAALESFCGLEVIQIENLVNFVEVIQPGARLRDKRGLNVRVGPHIPVYGGPQVADALYDILQDLWAATTFTGVGIGETDGLAYALHQRYEWLHPFTDGNGRSGRALWLWQMLRGGYDGGLGFLHKWYYQSLEADRKRSALSGMDR